MDIHRCPHIDIFRDIHLHLDISMCGYPVQDVDIYSRISRFDLLISRFDLGYLHAINHSSAASHSSNARTRQNRCHLRQSWSSDGWHTGKKTKVSCIPAREPKSVHLEHRTRECGHWCPSEHSLMDTRRRPSEHSLMATRKSPSSIF